MAALPAPAPVAMAAATAAPETVFLVVKPNTLLVTRREIWDPNLMTNSRLATSLLLSTWPAGLAYKFMGIPATVPAGIINLENLQVVGLRGLKVFSNEGERLLEQSRRDHKPPPPVVFSTGFRDLELATWHFNSQLMAEARYYGLGLGGGHLDVRDGPPIYLIPGWTKASETPTHRKLIVTQATATATTSGAHSSSSLLPQAEEMQGSLCTSVLVPSAAPLPPVEGALAQLHLVYDQTSGLCTNKTLVCRPVLEMMDPDAANTISPTSTMQELATALRVDPQWTVCFQLASASVVLTERLLNGYLATAVWPALDEAHKHDRLTRIRKAASASKAELGEMLFRIFEAQVRASSTAAEFYITQSTKSTFRNSSTGLQWLKSDNTWANVSPEQRAYIKAQLAANAPAFTLANLTSLMDADGVFLSPVDVGNRKVLPMTSLTTLRQLEKDAWLLAVQFSRVPFQSEFEVVNNMQFEDLSHLVPLKIVAWRIAHLASDAEGYRPYVLPLAANTTVQRALITTRDQGLIDFRVVGEAPNRPQLAPPAHSPKTLALNLGPFAPPVEFSAAIPARIIRDIEPESPGFAPGKFSAPGQWAWALAQTALRSGGDPQGCAQLEHWLGEALAWRLHVLPRTKNPGRPLPQDIQKAITPAVQNELLIMLGKRAPTESRGATAVNSKSVFDFSVPSVETCGLVVRLTPELMATSWPESAQGGLGPGVYPSFEILNTRMSEPVPALYVTNDLRPLEPALRALFALSLGLEPPPRSLGTQDPTLTQILAQSPNHRLTPNTVTSLGANLNRAFGSLYGEPWVRLLESQDTPRAYREAREEFEQRALEKLHFLRDRVLGPGFSYRAGTTRRGGPRVIFDTADLPGRFLRITVVPSIEVSTGTTIHVQNNQLPENHAGDPEVCFHQFAIELFRAIAEETAAVHHDTFASDRARELADLHRDRTALTVVPPLITVVAGGIDFDNPDTVPWIFGWVQSHTAARVAVGLTEKESLTSLQASMALKNLTVVHEPQTIVVKTGLGLSLEDLDRLTPGGTTHDLPAEAFTTFNVHGFALRSTRSAGMTAGSSLILALVAACTMLSGGAGGLLQDLVSGTLARRVEDFASQLLQTGGLLDPAFNLPMDEHTPLPFGLYLQDLSEACSSGLETILTVAARLGCGLTLVCPHPYASGRHMVIPLLHGKLGVHGAAREQDLKNVWVLARVEGDGVAWIVLSESATNLQTPGGGRAPSVWFVTNLPLDYETKGAFSRPPPLLVGTRGTYTVNSTSLTPTIAAMPTDPDFIRASLVAGNFPVRFETILDKYFIHPLMLHSVLPDAYHYWFKQSQAHPNNIQLVDVEWDLPAIGDLVKGEFRVLSVLGAFGGKVYEPLEISKATRDVTALLQAGYVNAGLNQTQAEQATSKLYSKLSRHARASSWRDSLAPTLAMIYRREKIFVWELNAEFKDDFLIGSILLRETGLLKRALGMLLEKKLAGQALTLWVLCVVTWSQNLLETYWIQKEAQLNINSTFTPSDLLNIAQRHELAQVSAPLFEGMSQVYDAFAGFKMADQQELPLVMLSCLLMMWPASLGAAAGTGTRVQDNCRDAFDKWVRPLLGSPLDEVDLDFSRQLVDIHNHKASLAAFTSPGLARINNTTHFSDTDNFFEGAELWPWFLYPLSYPSTGFNLTAWAALEKSAATPSDPSHAGTDEASAALMLLQCMSGVGDMTNFANWVTNITPFRPNDQAVAFAQAMIARNGTFDRDNALTPMFNALTALLVGSAYANMLVGAPPGGGGGALAPAAGAPGSLGVTANINTLLAGLSLHPEAQARFTAMEAGLARLTTDLGGLQTTVTGVVTDVAQLNTDTTRGIVTLTGHTQAQVVALNTAADARLGLLNTAADARLGVLVGGVNTDLAQSEGRVSRVVTATANALSADVQRQIATMNTGHTDEIAKLARDLAGRGQTDMNQLAQHLTVAAQTGMDQLATQLTDAGKVRLGEVAKSVSAALRTKMDKLAGELVASDHTEMDQLTRSVQAEMTQLTASLEAADRNEMTRLADALSTSGKDDMAQVATALADSGKTELDQLSGASQVHLNELASSLKDAGRAAMGTLSAELSASIQAEAEKTSTRASQSIRATEVRAGSAVKNVQLQAATLLTDLKKSLDSSLTKLREYLEHGDTVTTRAIETTRATTLQTARELSESVDRKISELHAAAIGAVEASQKLSESGLRQLSEAEASANQARSQALENSKSELEHLRKLEDELHESYKEHLRASTAEQTQLHQDSRGVLAETRSLMKRLEGASASPVLPPGADKIRPLVELLENSVKELLGSQREVLEAEKARAAAVSASGSSPSEITKLAELIGVERTALEQCVDRLGTLNDSLEATQKLMKQGWLDSTSSATTTAATTPSSADKVLKDVEKMIHKVGGEHEEEEAREKVGLQVSDTSMPSVPALTEEIVDIWSIFNAQMSEARGTGKLPLEVLASLGEVVEKHWTITLEAQKKLLTEGPEYLAHVGQAVLLDIRKRMIITDSQEHQKLLGDVGRSLRDWSGAWGLDTAADFARFFVLQSLWKRLGLPYLDLEVLIEAGNAVLEMRNAVWYVLCRLALIRWVNGKFSDLGKLPNPPLTAGLFRAAPTPWVLPDTWACYSEDLYDTSKESVKFAQKYGGALERLDVWRNMLSPGGSLIYPTVFNSWGLNEWAAGSLWTTPSPGVDMKQAAQDALFGLFWDEQHWKHDLAEITRPNTWMSVVQTRRQKILSGMLQAKNVSSALEVFRGSLNNRLLPYLLFENLGVWLALLDHDAIFDRDDFAAERQNSTLYLNTIIGDDERQLTTIAGAMAVQPLDFQRLAQLSQVRARGAQFTSIEPLTALPGKAPLKPTEKARYVHIMNTSLSWAPGDQLAKEGFMRSMDEARDVLPQKIITTLRAAAGLMPGLSVLLYVSAPTIFWVYLYPVLTSWTLEISEHAGLEFCCFVTQNNPGSSFVLWPANSELDKVKEKILVGLLYCPPAE